VPVDAYQNQKLPPISSHVDCAHASGSAAAPQSVLLCAGMGSSQQWLTLYLLLKLLILFCLEGDEQFDLKNKG
jgi:hypothetical protein